MSLIFQNLNLFSFMNVEDNILVPLYLTGKGIDKEVKEKIKYYLDLMKLGQIQDKSIQTLSGGEQQRVAIARAMLLKPSIVFADEPTGNLDSENTKLITNLFDNLNKKYGTTFIIVTHEENLMQNPDQIIRIKDGEVADE